MSIKKALVLDALQTLGAELDAHYHRINWGGCAVVAGMVGKRLESLGVKVDVVVPYVEENGEKYGAKPADIRGKVRGKNNARNWDEHGLDRAHLAVRLNFDGELYCWDTDALRKGGDRFGEREGFRCDIPFGEGLTPSEAKKFSDRQAGWNSTFSREQIPGMKRRVKRAFGELEKTLKTNQVLTAA